MTSEFAIAVHALVYLNHKGETVSSEALAENICTNPARVRKVMAKLKKAGLVATKEGVDGGYHFIKAPAEVTLRRIDEQQLAVAADGRVLGHIDVNGNVLDKDGKVIGKLQADGSVVDGEGNVIGMAGEKRKLVYDKNNKVIGYVDAKGKVLDFNGNVLGEAVEGGEIVDARGNVIGQLNKDGSAISLDGSVIGNTKLNWYEKPQPAQPAELPEVGAREVADVGQFKRSLNIALTPDGEYLGDILEDGNVVDKKGTVIGKLLPDGLIVDGEGSLIGIEEAAKKADTGEMFVPAGTFGQGGAYGTGMLTQDGVEYLYTYRDPHLKESYETFAKGPAELAGRDYTEKDMNEFIVGAAAKLDTPRKPREEAASTDCKYFCGITDEMTAAERKSLCSVDAAALKAEAADLSARMEKGVRVVFGSKEAVEAAKELFDRVETL